MPSFRGISDPTRISIEFFLRYVRVNGFGLAPIIERMMFETDERRSSDNTDYHGMTTRPRCRGCNRACVYTCKEISRLGSANPCREMAELCHQSPRR